VGDPCWWEAWGPGPLAPLNPALLVGTYFAQFLASSWLWAVAPKI